MTATVSKAATPVAAHYRYVFLVVTWQDYVHPVGEQIEAQIDAFGADLAGRGIVVRAFPRRSYEFYEEVKGKPWPQDIRGRMDEENAPFMVILAEDFTQFDPTDDEWAIIWFSDFDDEPARIRHLFATLAAKTRKGEDVIAYLQQVAARQQVSRLAKLASYIEIKPKVFGVSLDVTAILRDLSSASHA